VKGRLLGYVPYFGETSVCSGNQILVEAKQGDCPTVVATKWTNRNDNFDSQAATL
jgi:hypothetical protein